MIQQMVSSHSSLWPVDTSIIHISVQLKSNTRWKLPQTRLSNCELFNILILYIPFISQEDAQLNLYHPPPPPLTVLINTNTNSPRGKITRLHCNYLYNLYKFFFYKFGQIQICICTTFSNSCQGALQLFTMRPCRHKQWDHFSFNMIPFKICHLFGNILVKSAMNPISDLRVFCSEL